MPLFQLHLLAPSRAGTSYRSANVSQYDPCGQGSSSSREVTGGRRPLPRSGLLPYCWVTVVSSCWAEAAPALVSPVRYPHSRAARAVLAEARGDTVTAADLYLDAADRWAGFAMPIEEAHARLGAGRCLLALGRPAEATAAFERARSLWVSLQATPLLAETAALLEGAVSLSA